MKSSPGDDPPDSRPRPSEVVREFVDALRRNHTYSPFANAYFLFGLAWGLCLPLAIFAWRAWQHDAGLAFSELATPGTGAGLLFLVPPTVLSIVFGALGTIRRDKHHLTAQTIRLLDGEVTERSNELARAYTETVLALSQAIEAKDPYTRGHCYRVWQFAERAATHLGVRNGDLRTLEHACFLHDVGKIRIPGRILNKPGPLTPEEVELVKLHPVYSERIVAPIVQFKEVTFLIRHHHERADGAGYPDGLKGEEHSLLLRVLIVADALDAMTSDRPYRKGLAMEVALEELKRCAGLPFDAALLPPGRAASHQFDPLVVRAMIDALSERPVAGPAPMVPTREDIQIADYVVRTSATPVPASIPRKVNPARQNCWQVKGCERGPGGRRVEELGACPAGTAVNAHGLNGGHHGGRICWAVAATACLASDHHTGQGPAHCSDCSFFRQVKSEEGLTELQLVTPSQRKG